MSGQTVINGKTIEAGRAIALKVNDEVMLGKNAKLVYQRLSSHSRRTSSLNQGILIKSPQNNHDENSKACQNDLSFIEWTVNGKIFKIRRGDLISMENGLSEKIKQLKSMTRSKEAEIMNQMDSEAVIQRIKASQELYQRLCSVFANKQQLAEAEEAIVAELENPLLAFGGAINPLKVLAKSKIDKLQKNVLQLEFLSALNSLGEKAFEKAIEVI
jgi:hypothetical protein